MRWDFQLDGSICLTFDDHANGRCHAEPSFSLDGDVLRPVFNGRHGPVWPYLYSLTLTDAFQAAFRNGDLRNLASLFLRASDVMD
jgi:hypothetical protein